MGLRPTERTLLPNFFRITVPNRLAVIPNAGSHLSGNQSSGLRRREVPGARPGRRNDDLERNGKQEALIVREQIPDRIYGLRGDYRNRKPDIRWRLIGAYEHAQAPYHSVQ